MEEFYRENYGIVFGFLFSLCGDRHMAEDLTSETFLKAIVNINSYDGRVKASTWLCTIGKNLYINEMKKKKPSSIDDLQPANSYSLEEQVLESERIRLIKKLAEDLEDPKRQVFHMRWQGMSFRQIGDALGKSESWARVTFFRAKEKILERMEEPE